MTVIAWKDKDEVGGMAIGPTYEVGDDGEVKEELGWMSKPEAMRLAEGMAIEFEEV